MTTSVPVIPPSGGRIAALFSGESDPPRATRAPAPLTWLTRPTAPVVAGRAHRPACGRPGGRPVTGRPDSSRPGRGWPRPDQGRQNRRHRRLERLVLPDPDHVPAGRGQRGVGRPVTLDVAAQLGLPVPDVARGPGAVLGAGMPEAAVDEDRDAPGRERDIGPDSLAVGQIKPVVLPEPVPLAVQGPAQRQFGLGVGAPVGPHVGRAPLTGRVRVLGHAPQGRAPPASRTPLRSRSGDAGWSRCGWEGRRGGVGRVGSGEGGWDQGREGGIREGRVGSGKERARRAERRSRVGAGSR